MGFLNRICKRKKKENFYRLSLYIPQVWDVLNFPDKSPKTRFALELIKAFPIRATVRRDGRLRFEVFGDFTKKQLATFLRGLWKVAVNYNASIGELCLFLYLQKEKSCSGCGLPAFNVFCQKCGNLTERSNKMIHNTVRNFLLLSLSKEELRLEKERQVLLRLQGWGIFWR